ALLGLALLSLALLRLWAAALRRLSLGLRGLTRLSALSGRTRAWVALPSGVILLATLLSLPLLGLALLALRLAGGRRLTARLTWRLPRLGLAMLALRLAGGRRLTAWLALRLALFTLLLALLGLTARSGATVRWGGRSGLSAAG